ncbi:retrotransposon protein, putative, ty1-copia subclass [Tanacetum coccineum]
MKGYMKQLERLGYVLPQDLSYEKGLPKKAVTPQVMAIQGGRIQKVNKKSLNAKGKLIKKKKQVGTASSSGKMIRKPFPYRTEKATDLGIIHPDVCGPLRHVSRQGASYFVTFTDDYSRYGYIYLLKHKHEVFETFKVFKNEVENQLGMTIKALRSDRGGEYISQEFKDYLKACGIVQQLTPPYTPQHNRLCSGDCYTHSQYGSNQEGYPKETMGYYFYFPLENKIVVAMYTELLEKNLLSQEVSGRAKELEEIQDKETLPSENTSKIPMEVEGFEPPQEEVVLVRRSARTHRDPERLCLNVEVEEHSLGDLNESNNYKAAILDLESDKWVDSMNAKMHSVKDNRVWCLVDLPPNCKTVGNKWLIKKMTDMDNIVHTYKARLVAKGFTQTYEVDYEETFSPVADTRAIRILIAITAFYDYEIWQMDVKTAFLNGYLNEDIYMLFDLNKTQGASTPEEVKRMQNVPYALAVGSIMYAVRCIRPDVEFTQNITSYFQQNPGKPHWTAVKM